MGCLFDQVVDRRNTHCMKWDGATELYGTECVIPMWIADMDFRPPESVVQSVCERAVHGVYGYERKPQSYLQAVVGWLKNRHHWEIPPEWICNSPGVVSGLSLALQLFTKPEDKILIQPPVYPPFFSAIQGNRRVVVESPLVIEEGRYTMDFNHLEQEFAQGVKLMILCSPHNPVGRVWTREELQTLAELALTYQVLLLSDEIWSDLVFPLHNHIPIASLSKEIAEQTITFMAPSKTFNLAGFYTSHIVIPHETHRKAFHEITQSLSLNHNNLFGLVAAECAYTKGEPWLTELLSYLEGNIEFAIQYLADLKPQIKVIRPEGTFLLWLDCRGLEMEPSKQNQFFVAKAGVALNDGASFGKLGQGFQRMNVGCPRRVVHEALSRIDLALTEYGR